MAVARTGGSPTGTRMTHRLARLYWPALRWSAAAGALGGLLGWAVGEAVTLPQHAAPLYSVYLHAFAYFLVVSAGIGVLNRSRHQAVRGALIGGAVGGIGGGLGGLPAQWVFNALGDGLLARAVAWALVGVCIGLCPGAATRDRRRALRGLLGGTVGGFVGGLLFNLAWDIMPHSATDTGTSSRFIADVVVGVCIGLLVALVEVVLKNAWLTVASGRREGAQFILSKECTSIGRDDRDDVLLWGDAQLATRHARIIRRHDGCVLESLSAEAPTLVNGRPVGPPAPLRDGDEIVLGSTRLLFHAHGTPPQLHAPSVPAGRAAATVPPVSPAASPAALPAASLHASPAAPAPGVFPPATPALGPSPSPASAVGPLPPPVPPAAVSPAAVSPVVAPGVGAPGACGGLAGPAARAGAGYRLAPLGAGASVQALPRQRVVTVGRDPGNDVVLDDGTVSARHAELRWEEGRWVVYDLGSTNGTYVAYGCDAAGERPVTRNALKDGSVVRFGRAAFQLERADAP